MLKEERSRVKMGMKELMMAKIEEVQWEIQICNLHQEWWETRHLIEDERQRMVKLQKMRRKEHKIMMETSFSSQHS